MQQPIKFSPFYCNLFSTSTIEKDFFHYLDEQQNIDWCFKNADYGRDSFTIPYKNENGERKLFYPDFLVKQKNKLGIFDTKDGIIAKDAKQKAEVLRKFIKEKKSENLKLWGGIVIETNNKIWKLNQNENYFYNEINLINWVDLKF